MQSDLKMMEVTARLGMLEKLVSDLLLNQIYYGPVPHRMLEDVREKTISAIATGSTAPPGTTAADADVLLEVQSKTIEFAERFFDGLEQDLDRVMEQTQDETP